MHPSERSPGWAESLTGTVRGFSSWPTTFLPIISALRQLLLRAVEWYVLLKSQPVRKNGLRAAISSWSRWDSNPTRLTPSYLRYAPSSNEDSRSWLWQTD